MDQPASALAFLDRLAETALAGAPVAEADALRLLTDPTLPLLPLLHAAWRVRHHHFGNGVRVHILNNAQNGACPEDCRYCAQAKGSDADIPRYALKPDADLLAEARAAAEAGAYRYCMVMAGRGPRAPRVAHMAEVVRRIKDTVPVEVCLSAGFLDREAAATLKAAGLDRYNHNLNTAESLYGDICTTHTYADRVATLEAARAEGLEVCSGVILGMGETPQEVVTLATTLRRLDARSIPVNFYVHVPGAALGPRHDLTPVACLRALALFRFVNPDAELRAAGGREVHLGSLQALALYPANSVFAEGYLNTEGLDNSATLRMIAEAGFTVETVET